MKLLCGRKETCKMGEPTMVKCEDCDGSGLVDCSYCGAMDMEDCSECDGSGEVESTEEENV